MGHFLDPHAPWSFPEPTRIRPLCALESYVFHVTLELLQELQIHMVMLEPLGDWDTAVDLVARGSRWHLTWGLARPHITASLPKCYGS